MTLGNLLAYFPFHFLNTKMGPMLGGQGKVLSLHLWFSGERDGPIDWALAPPPPFPAFRGRGVNPGVRKSCCHADFVGVELTYQKSQVPQVPPFLVLISPGYIKGHHHPFISPAGPYAPEWASLSTNWEARTRGSPTLPPTKPCSRIQRPFLAGPFSSTCLAVLHY